MLVVFPQLGYKALHGKGAFLTVLYSMWLHFEHGIQKNKLLLSFIEKKLSNECLKICNLPWYISHFLPESKVVHSENSLGFEFIQTSLTAPLAIQSLRRYRFEEIFNLIES